MYIGYPNLVRGYDVNTFELEECLAALGNVGSCPAFDRLIGSRILVANVEFRFPILRPFGVTQNMYGPIPMEVALFADAGVAWSRGVNPSLFAAGGGRDGVSSVGAALRVNFFGFITQFSLPNRSSGRSATGSSNGASRQGSKLKFENCRIAGL